MRLDETRIRQAFFERAQDRIETLDVADLKNEPATGREFRQFAGVRRVFRDRLFDQEMFVLRQQFARDFEMRVGRSGDRSGVDLLGKLFAGKRRPRRQIRRRADALWPDPCRRSR